MQITIGITAHADGRAVGERGSIDKYGKEDEDGVAEASVSEGGGGGRHDFLSLNDDEMDTSRLCARDSRERERERVFALSLLW